MTAADALDAFRAAAPIRRLTQDSVDWQYRAAGHGTQGLLCCLRTILERERLDSADIVGGSFGGLIAQAFLRRFPQRTRRVVLSATGSAKPERAASSERFARFMARLPMGVARALLRTIVRASLRLVTSDRAFWRGFYFQAIAALSRDEFVARYALSADADRHGPPSPAGLQEWAGSMLMLEGEADKIAAEIATSLTEASDTVVK